MTDLVTTGLCLAGSACIVRALAWWIGSGRARLHDLTRPADYLCQVERQHRNELAVEAYQRRLAASGHAPVRRARVVPEPAQLHGWEDDGGTPA